MLSDLEIWTMWAQRYAIPPSIAIAFLIIFFQRIRKKLLFLLLGIPISFGAETVGAFVWDSIALPLGRAEFWEAHLASFDLYFRKAVCVPLMVVLLAVLARSIDPRTKEPPASRRMEPTPGSGG